MGSDSDLPCMKDAAEQLELFGIPYEMQIVSAHRTPQKMFDYARSVAPILIHRGSRFLHFSLVDLHFFTFVECGIELTTHGVFDLRISVSLGFRV